MTTAAEQLTAAIEAHGYHVDVQPLPGEEAQHLAHLRGAFAKIEATLARNAREYGYRGLSKPALAALHGDMPSPAWGIDL